MSSPSQTAESKADDIESIVLSFSGIADLQPCLQSRIVENFVVDILLGKWFFDQCIAGILQTKRNVVPCH